MKVSDTAAKLPGARHHCQWATRRPPSDWRSGDPVGDSQEAIEEADHPRVDEQEALRPEGRVPRLGWQAAVENLRDDASGFTGELVQNALAELRRSGARSSGIGLGTEEPYRA